MMKHTPDSHRAEVNLARRKWAEVGEEKIAELRKFVCRYRLSVALGDVLYFNSGWYVTHAGLLRLAHRSRCLGIKTILERRCSDPVAGRWVFKAIVYKSSRSKGFVGYGDADPSNVSPLVRGAEMRVAETRAVNRALRKAYGIGLCSVEELGWTAKVSDSPKSNQNGCSPVGANGNGHSAPPRLRDRLCFLIREHQLDPTLVKAYAADSCGSPNLRDASREQIEGFITNLADWATKDRPALVCKLNSYAAPHEVTS
jgi:hypothetical protein